MNGQQNDAKTNNTDKITKTSKMSPLPNDKLINTTAESQNKLKEEEEKKKKEEEEKKKNIFLQQTSLHDVDVFFDKNC